MILLQDVESVRRETMGIKVTAQRVKLPTGYVVNFTSEVDGVEPEKLPVVCLSRNKPGKCMFRADLLHEHDGHSPRHDDLDHANAYIERVFKDIQDGLLASEVIGQLDVVDVKVILVPVPVPFSQMSDN